MAIQWFPGHMHLTRQAIADRIINRCGWIELLDARFGSSANPCWLTWPRAARR
jgi:ribosome biogenesis GTPase A